MSTSDLDTIQTLKILKPWSRRRWGKWKCQHTGFLGSIQANIFPEARWCWNNRSVRKSLSVPQRKALSTPIPRRETRLPASAVFLLCVCSPLAHLMGIGTHWALCLSCCSLPVICWQRKGSLGKDAHVEPAGSVGKTCSYWWFWGSGRCICPMLWAMTVLHEPPSSHPRHWFFFLFFFFRLECHWTYI